MADDLDDTVIRGGRPALRGLAPDVEDTILSRAAPVSTPAPTVPPPAPRAPTLSRSHYAIRVGDDGAPISLDVPCYLGRRPRLPRIETGITPRLVTVASPRGEVSGTHVEIRQVGTAVVVTDLRSTNGTVVRLPGHVARTLRQGESVVVAPGTLVELGDDIVVHVLSWGALASHAKETGSGT